MDKQYLFGKFTNSNFNKSNESIHVVVAKPTRVCNASCSYCSSPPLEELGSNWEPEWSIDTFKKYFSKVFPYMVEGSCWIWHGGEPMLMGDKFYSESFEFAKTLMEKYNKKIYFSMQSNMLGYNEKWKRIFEDVFNGSISTSYDPDETNRTLKGKWENYSRIFKKSLDKIIDDGFYPMVIGVYKEENANKMHDVYDWSISRGANSFPIRFNYCVPTGRSVGNNELISPETYANYLIEVYNRWIVDVPDFTVTPLDQMFKKVTETDGQGHCPWQRGCGGRFIAIEPDGSVYNCTDFADLGSNYSFGSLEHNSVPELLNSTQAMEIKRRTYKLPQSCLECEHFRECEGGCARDSLLFENGMYGKFHYCKSWKMVFTRIKESILKGEADKIIAKYGLDIEITKGLVRSNIESHFGEKFKDISSIDSKVNKYGFYDYMSNKQNPMQNEDLVPVSQKNYNINKKLKKIPIVII